MPAKKLPEAPLNPVPDDSGADFPAGDDRQPGIVELVPAEDQMEISSPNAAAVPIEAREIAFPADSLGRRQTLIHPTETRFRPLRLLLLMTSWPPLVFMRTRKPCVFLRLLLFG